MRTDRKGQELVPMIVLFYYRALALVYIFEENRRDGRTCLPACLPSWLSDSLLNFVPTEEKKRKFWEYNIIYIYIYIVLVKRDLLFFDKCF